jgi:hypothetical protein
MEPSSFTSYLSELVSWGMPLAFTPLPPSMIWEVISTSPCRLVYTEGMDVGKPEERSMPVTS